MLPVMHQALDEAHVRFAEIDSLAVTRGPGLLGSLLVGTTAARTLAHLRHKPLIGVHHTLGHLSSTWLDNSVDDAPQFPIVTLSASGGHTDLWLRTSHLHGTLLGHTRDDAAGEAFDKGAQLLELPYPGGPAIAQLAQEGDATAYDFPQPLHKEQTFDFSFSGLKTALRTRLRACPDAGRADLAASYQAALCRHLVRSIRRAVALHPHIKEVHLVGGVSANTVLRTVLQDTIPTVRCRFPQQLLYCTDNAAMIGAAAQCMHDAMGSDAWAPFETHASLPLAAAVQEELGIA
jgi:N6-L-threonylcarbamoyladenine synthase